MTGQKFISIHQFELLALASEVEVLVQNIVSTWQELKQRTMASRFGYAIDDMVEYMVDGFGQEKKEAKIDRFHACLRALEEGFNWTKKAIDQQLIQPKLAVRLQMRLFELLFSMQQLIKETNAEK